MENREIEQKILRNSILKKSILLKIQHELI